MYHFLSDLEHINNGGKQATCNKQERESRNRLCDEERALYILVIESEKLIFYLFVSTKGRDLLGMRVELIRDQSVYPKLNHTRFSKVYTSCLSH